MKEKCEQKCSTCDFYNGNDESGTCWRFPPVYVSGVTAVGWKRPEVLPSGDCGEWKAKFNKYEKLMRKLDQGEVGSMKVFGKSMEPIIYSGSVLKFKSFPDYVVDDIVFCKVENRVIDAHKITAIKKIDKYKEYLIANNHGYVNGWTSIIYGRVIDIFSNKNGK